MTGVEVRQAWVAADRASEQVRQRRELGLPSAGKSRAQRLYNVAAEKMKQFAAELRARDQGVY